MHPEEPERGGRSWYPNTLTRARCDAQIVLFWQRLAFASLGRRRHSNVTVDGARAMRFCISSLWTNSAGSKEKSTMAVSPIFPPPPLERRQRKGGRLREGAGGTANRIPFLNAMEDNSTAQTRGEGERATLHVGLFLFFVRGGN